MKKKYITILFILLSILGYSQTFENIAGDGTSGFSGDNGLAINAQLDHPSDLAIDNSGNVYLTDRTNNRIRKIDNNGVITTIAGNGNSAYSGDGNISTNSEINTPLGIIVYNGEIYFAEASNNCIRKIDVNGIITTVAGNGSSGFSGDNGLAINAQLNSPRDIAFDNNGNFYITDAVNKRIRRVDTNGIITTICGNGNFNTSGDNGLANNAEISFPNSIFIDGSNIIYFTDITSNIIRKIDTNNIITLFAGNMTEGFSGDNGIATNAQLDNPSHLTMVNGNLYFSDFDNQRIRKIDMNGIISTYAGGTFECSVNGSLVNYQNKGVNGLEYHNGSLYVVNELFCNTITKITDSSLSIDENILSSFSLFPNPVNDFVNIKSQNIIKRVDVFDLLGKTILSEKLNKHDFTMNLKSLKTGIYILKIVSENEVESVKIMKK